MTAAALPGEISLDATHCATRNFEAREAGTKIDKQLLIL